MPFTDDDKQHKQMKPATANDNVKALAPSQLQELHGVLKNPISGRQVMIPLTGKAFVLGSLQPQKSPEGDEVVLVRPEVGAELKEMPRKAVCDLLMEEKQRKRDQGKSKKPEPSTKEANIQQDSKPSLRSNPPSAATGSCVPALPYFDIKEELDGAGKVVRSEAVNVTKQLELVTKHVNGSDGEYKESEAESKENSNLDNQEESYFDVEMYEDEKDTRAKTVTDQEYQTLSDRLDELARLEEEAEAKAEENNLSKLRLQSKGWAKGFLSGKVSAPTKANTKNAKPQTSNEPTSMQQPTAQSLELKEKNDQQQKQQPSSEPKLSKKPAPKQSPSGQAISSTKTKTKTKSGWSKGFLNNCSPDIKTNKAKQTQPCTPQQKGTDSDSSSSKRVSFQSNMEEVHEIPRIGQTPVASLQKPKPPPSASSPGPGPGPGPARPFDRSVFSGVVKERPIRPMIPASQQQQQQQQQQQSQQEEKPKNRVSRFAQQRMETK